ncbi:STAS domain-containing protein [Streptomyces leeuwenhoekii]|uniref:Anti-sigma factor antagonist n=1 Tax=Streptomyces leeuwenhoekii TaxID=1437453 RepID=A0A0F7VQG6_STRLW|nr:STAS domain-containing protein [Streptomyces leeuwenhoekii]CQR59667.1 Anti-Sigma-Factor Antagonist [Streptomyces leeuwenhoekii]
MSTGRPASSDRQDNLELQARSLRADRSLVSVSGVLDLHTASRLADILQPLLQGSSHSVLVDLSGVTFLDSTGLTCLIAAYRTGRTTGAGLVLIAPSERVRRMLALTGADQVLHSYPTADAVPDRPLRHS